MISIDVGLGGTVSGALEIEVIITPVIPPASADLVAGQSLSDTPNWSTFSNTANYTTNNPGQTILEVVVNYIGDTADATTPLQDGQRNAFSITVIDTGGAHTTFPVQERITAYPAPVAAGNVSDQTYGLNTPISTLDITGDFSGNAIAYALAPSSAPLPEGLSLSTDGQITGTPTTPTAQAALVVRGTNSGGFAETAFEISVLAISPTVVSSVTIGLLADGRLPITLNAANAISGNTAYWVIYPVAENIPTATQIILGQRQDGSAAIDSGSGIWPGPFGSILISGIPAGFYKVAMAIDNGLLSNAEESQPFEIDTSAPTLSIALAARSGADVSWSVTSDQPDGTIYAALRNSTDTPLAAAEIIAGTGNALATDSDITPTADAQNGGTFTSLASGTYAVDVVQEDSFGNQSQVLSSSSVIITPTTGLARGTTTQIIDSAVIKTTFTSGADGGSSVTPAAGSNRMLTFVTYWTNHAVAPVTPPTLSFGGVAATLVGSYVSPSAYSPCFTIHRLAEADIPVGVSETTITAVQDIFRVSCHLIEYSGLDQTIPFGSAVSFNSNNSTGMVTLNATVATSFILSGTYWRSGATLAPITPTTDSGGIIDKIVERSITGDDVNGIGAIADEMFGATGNVTHTFTANQGIPLVTFAIELFEA